MNKSLCLALALCAAAQARAQQRLTPQQLQAALADGDKVTLIDLRPQEAYAKGTLPDALRMGAREALEKKLAGTVVFFDDGLGVNRARRAAETFSKAGKNAAELAGGYAAWRAAGLPTSERKGMTPRTERYVTYQDLAGAIAEDADDVVLLDVRETPPETAPAAPQPAGRGLLAAEPEPAAAPAGEEPLDLAAAFPAFRVARAPLPAQPAAGRGPSASAADSSQQPLYILIDRGDGLAERKAAELRAAGHARVSVLAGGETIIRRKGEPGLLRRGPGAGLATDRAPDQKNMATIAEEVAP